MASLESTHHYPRKYEVFTLTQTCEILMNNNLLLGNFHCITVVYRYVLTKIKKYCKIRLYTVKMLS